MCFLPLLELHKDGRNGTALMNNPDYPKVSAPTLQQTVLRYHKIELILAGLILVSTGLVCFYWFQRFGASLPYFGAFLCFGTLLITFSQLEVPDGLLVDEAEADLLGRYTPEELHEMVRELCLSFDESELPNIYILRSSEANAAVINVDLLNWIRPWNAVYVSSYLLHTLEPDELKAILSHEMCHFSLHVTFWSRFFYLKPFIFSIWVTFVMSYPIEWLWIKTAGGFRFWLLFFLLATFGIIHFVWQFSSFVAGLVVAFSYRPDSQEIESLCDFEGAKRYGVLAMTNALLKIGSRQEIFSRLLAMLSPNESDPMQLPEQLTLSGYSTSRSRSQYKHPAYLRAKERLRQARKELLESDDEHEPTEDEIQESMLLERSETIAKAYEHLSEHLPHGFISLEESEQFIQDALEASEGEVYKHVPRELLRWLDFDDFRPNARIDREEYPAFIKALKQHPDIPLFFIPEEFTPALASEAEHPTLKKRILFLDYNTELKLLQLETEAS